MEQNEFFLYVIKGNKNPDKIEGLVPFCVSDKYIFFGPGDTAFRKVFRDRFLSRSDEFSPTSSIFVIGVNDPLKEPVRKILWVGKLTNVMTFFNAYRLIDEPEFQSLDVVEIDGKPGENHSPLHVMPIGLMGKLSGYRHRTKYHDKIDRDGLPEWVKDIVDPRDKAGISITGDDMMLVDISKRKDVLRRDVCFLCENIFFASEKGMEIDNELVSILDQHQPGAGVDNVAIFGYSQSRSGSRTMNKIKSTHLHIRWKLADRFVEYVMKHK
ncbi:MAG TPA: hypothetical protein ENN67_07025 [Firmicutes bacterium]|nr:hypothetical protein [Bacillota bacterium]